LGRNDRLGDLARLAIGSLDLVDKRRRTFDAGTRMLCLAFVASFAVLLSLADPREVYALPLLLPLSLLAGAGRRRCAAAQPMRSPRSG